MKVLGVVGPTDTGKTSLVERLVSRLEERGRVATVKHLTHPPDVDTEGTDTARHRAAGAAETHGLTDDGDWFATGVARSLAATLDDLAADHDYAVVEGFSSADLPQVVLGGREHRGEAVATGETADDIDLDDAVAAMADAEPYESLGSLVAETKRSPDAEKAGAIATFTGRVRAKEHDDDAPTEALEFEKYEGVAEDRLQALRTELAARDGVYEVLMHHRTGVIEYGDDIVFVVVLAGHRREAFETVEDGIDRLKEDVPIFKKEVTVEDEFWVHQR